MIVFLYCLTYVTHYTPIQNVLGIKKKQQQESTLKKRA